MKRHIIADWDGVLGNTADMNYGIVTELHPEVVRDDYLINHHLGNVFETPVVPFTPETTARYYELYNERLGAEHVQAALTAIKNLGSKYCIHIVTSNCEHAVRNALRETGAESLFGHMLGQEAHASKVEKFHRLFADDDFTAEESLYITDTVGDLKEAAKVDLRTIAVTFGYHPKELLQAHHPTRIADTWNEVIAHVDELMN